MTSTPKKILQLFVENYSFLSEVDNDGNVEQKVTITKRLPHKADQHDGKSSEYI